MNKTDFIMNGFKMLSNLGGIAVQLSSDGESIRYQRYENKPSRWGRVHLAHSGRAYFYCNGRREYLDEYTTAQR